MSGITIRDERESDRDTVQRIHEQAFGRPEEARLVERLRAEAWPRVSLVAERDGYGVGHVFFSPVSIEGAPDAPACGGLAPLAVLPEVQGRGVGAALTRAGLEACRALGWQAVFVLGEPAYYGRFGFRLAGPAGLHYVDASFDRAFQVLELTAGALAACSGRVLYHDAFAAV